MFLWIFFILLMPVTEIWAQEINLSPGESRQINSHGQAWVEKAKIIQVSEAHGGFKIKALKPGSSLLKIGRKQFQIFVLSAAQERAKLFLQPALLQTMNLNLKIKKGKVLVQGQLVLVEDLLKLYQACENNDCEYSLEIKTRREIYEQLQKLIERTFRRNGLAPQRLVFGDHISALVSENSTQSKASVTILKNWGIEPILSSENIELAPLIKVQITIAEVRKDAAMKYGVQWPGSYHAQVLPTDAAAGFGEGEAFGLHMLESEGVGKILASPNILCRSGKSAEFVAGGEFPIKIINAKMQDVLWKRYGIVLKVSPKADYSGKMSISIETEVSSIDTSRTIDQVPGLFTNRLQSHFDLSETRVIALSGLIKSEQGQASQGLPGLSQIPILGALFSSKDFKENRTELVVFVKPEVVSPGSLEAEL
jgi:pilus assembly protein CpaC